MTVRAYTRSVFVNNVGKTETLKTLRGERVYILIENRSSASGFLNPDTLGGSNDGIEIPVSFRYELWKPFCPQNDFFLSGNAAADQRFQITEGYEE